MNTSFDSYDVYYVKSKLWRAQALSTDGLSLFTDGVVLLWIAFFQLFKMIKFPSLAPSHLPALHMLIDGLHSRTPASIAAHLDVSPLTVRRWIAADEAPRAVALALFWETRWGLSALDAEAVNLVRTTTGLTNALRRENATLAARVAYLEGVGQFGSANAPMFLHLPVDQLRQV